MSREAPLRVDKHRAGTLHSYSLKYWWAAQTENKALNRNGRMKKAVVDIRLGRSLKRWSFLGVSTADKAEIVKKKTLHFLYFHIHKTQDFVHVF